MTRAKKAPATEATVMLDGQAFSAPIPIAAEMLKRWKSQPDLLKAAVAADEWTSAHVPLSEFGLIDLKKQLGAAIEKGRKL